MSSAPLQINLWTTALRHGGAGIATLRLHHALSDLGLHSRLCSAEASAEYPALATVGVAAQALVQSELIAHQRPARSNTRFSLPTGGLTDRSALVMSGIHHLHWINDLLGLNDIAQLHASGQPVVWTFHDHWPMTGGCHYHDACDQYRAACQDCPQLEPTVRPWAAQLLAAKHERLARNPPAVICPSAWMARSVQASSLFQRSRITVIPNAINTTVFQPGDRAAARIALGLPGSAKILLFVADQHGERRKGFDLLIAILAELGTRITGLLCLTLGGDTDTTMLGSCPLIGLGRINADAALAQVYAACDLVVVPSREDNLPNILIESAACGIPAVGFDVGGIPEIISSGSTGLLAGTPEPENLITAIENALSDVPRLRTWGAAARRDAVERYAAPVVAAQHRDLYQDLAARQPTVGQLHPVAWRDLDLVTAAAQCRAARLQKSLQTSETDRAARLAVMEQQAAELRVVNADHQERGQVIERLSRELAATTAQHRDEHAVNARLHNLIARLDSAVRPLHEQIDAQSQELQLAQQALREEREALRHSNARNAIAQNQIETIERDRAVRLELIEQLSGELDALRDDQQQRGEVIAKLDADLQTSEADRAQRLDLLNRQAAEHHALADDHQARGTLIAQLTDRLAQSERDRDERLAIIDRQAAELAILSADHHQRSALIARLTAELRISEDDRTRRLALITRQAAALEAVQRDHLDRGTLIEQISLKLDISEHDRAERLTVIEAQAIELRTLGAELAKHLNTIDHLTAELRASESARAASAQERVELGRQRDELAAQLAVTQTRLALVEPYLSLIQRQRQRPVLGLPLRRSIPPPPVS